MMRISDAQELGSGRANTCRTVNPMGIIIRSVFSRDAALPQDSFRHNYARTKWIHLCVVRARFARHKRH
jgi:hypothetical protein